MLGPNPRPPPTDEDGGLDDALLGDLIDPLLEEGSDDERAAVETEMEIDEPPALSADDGIEIDAGDPIDELSLLPENGFDDDSTLGPDENDRHAEFEGMTPLEREDLPDGPDEPLPSLDLPEVEAELADERTAENDAGELEASLSFGDEPRPESSSARWHENAPSIELEPCSALTVAEGTALAASTDLLWFSRGELSPLRLEAGSTRIHDVVLLGSNREYAFCSTTSGRLFRRGRAAPTPEEIRAPRPVAENRREPLDLFQMDAQACHSVLARTASGQLLRSDDDGATFSRLPALRALALAHTGRPLTVLGEGARLLRSHDRGGTFDELPLSGFARDLADSRLPLLAADGDVVALAAEALGIAVSSDAGRTFTRVLGSRGVTALCVSAAGAGTRVFAALESDALDQSLLLEIDPLTAVALVIARIGGEAEDEASDRVRVARLEWDAEQGRLWAAGAFGVKVFAPG
jgi:hypothetical protein